MADSAPVPSIWELDYCDLTLYQHPPCMFTLWYLGLAVNAAWEPVKDLVDRIIECLGGDGGGGGGGKKKDGGEENEGGEGGEAKEGDGGGEEEEGAEEQAPAEEEGEADEAAEG